MNQQILSNEDHEEIKQELIKLLSKCLQENNEFTWPGFFIDLEVKYELKHGRKAKSPLIKKMKKYVKNWEDGESFGDKLLREVLELPANFELDYFREMDTFYIDEIRKTKIS